MLSKNLDATYKRACMANAKEKCWLEMYDTITNYNDRKNTPLSNAGNIKAIGQVIIEEEAESNNITVGTFRPQRN